MVHGPAQRRPHPVDDAAVQRRIAVGGGQDRGRRLRCNRTQADLHDRPGQAGGGMRPGAEIEGCRVGDQGRPHPLSGHRGVVSSHGAKHRVQAREERSVDGGSRPDVAPAALELLRQLRDHLLAADVAVEHLDARPVPVVVHPAKDRLGGVGIAGPGCSPGHRELEADREVQLLGVARRDAEFATLLLEDVEPGCRTTQLLRMAEDADTHRGRGIGGRHRRRELRVGTQPQHQRVEDPFDGAPQRGAIRAAQDLHARPDRPPRLVDHRAPRRRDGGWGGGGVGHHAWCRGHRPRIRGLGPRIVPRSWVR